MNIYKKIHNVSYNLSFINFFIFQGGGLLLLFLLVVFFLGNYELFTVFKKKEQYFF
jgi:hypothetical protein